MLGSRHQAALLYRYGWHKNKSHEKISLQTKLRSPKLLAERRNQSMKRMILTLTAMMALALPVTAQEMKMKEQSQTPQVKTHQRVEASTPNMQTRERTQVTTQRGPSKERFSERTINRVSRTEVINRHPEFRERHDRGFFESRFGRHFRFFNSFNEYFVFVDGCWIAVDVDGFVFADRTICPGDPDFIEVEIE